MEGPPPEMGVEVTPKGLRFDESWDESWTDRPVVPKSSPRLARSLRSTGVLWESLAPKTVADFAMENCNPVPSDVQRQRLYAHERLRQRLAFLRRFRVSVLGGAHLEAAFFEATLTQHVEKALALLQCCRCCVKRGYIGGPGPPSGARYCRQCCLWPVSSRREAERRAK